MKKVEAMKGIRLQGDIHAIPQGNRQILLIEKKTLDRLNLQPFMVRENIITQVIDLVAEKG
ncbi:MAG TPA: hypothetical protein VI704_04465 [Bacteroidota bacterium]|nr:hypothetical protein [Bacteroidota bacterium]